jgi:long-chain acyl-CoA synthetase
VNQVMTQPTSGQIAIERATHAKTLGAMFLEAAEMHDGPALRWKSGGAWTEMSFRAVGIAVREIARGLISLGVEPGDRVAILSNTRPEWTLADAGTLCAGATVVPIYQTNSAGECRYVLQHSDASVVFCEDDEQLAKVEEVRGDLPALRHVIALTGEGADSISLDELRARGSVVKPGRVDERAAAASADDVATLVYTSGTTGPPKGCMLTHRNFLSTMGMYQRAIEIREPVIFIFLPLAHSLARVTQMVALDVGGTLVFWERDAAKLLGNIQEASPTHFPSVPRVFEKIFTAATAGIAEQPAIKRAIFKWALATGRKAREAERGGRGPGPFLRRSHRLADRLALSKVRGLFGDRLELALTGAAPVAADVLEFFDACGVLVLEGYGMTESTAAGSLNTPAAHRFGTVGPPLPGTEVGIAPDGEVLMRGPHVFAGYFKDAESTADTLVDGWLHTGDLGSVSGDGYLSITGRKKDIIITSSGKNITPTNIENALKESRWISEAVVSGDQHPYLVALLTLDSEEAPKLAEQVGVDPDPAGMARDERVVAAIQKEVDAVNERFARIEQVKRFLILDHELTQADGDLTPTMKVKRAVVYRKYADEIAALYEQ